MAESGPALAATTEHLMQGHDNQHSLVVVDEVVVTFMTRRGIFRRERVRALNRVSMAIDRGETLALVGESGSGKTTLGRVSLRLIKPTDGQVRFDGQDISAADENDLGWFRRRAQIIFQDPFSSLNPYMRVGDLVEEPLIIDGRLARPERADRVRESLAAVDLVPAGRFISKYPGQLSGGAAPAGRDCSRVGQKSGIHRC